MTNVTSLLKTVKAVEDEHTRGTRALESTIEAIGQEIRALNTPDSHRLNVTPEDLVRCTKGITTATAKAVAAGNSCKQDDIIAAANLGRKSISDMLAICKATAYNCAETPELRDRTLQAGHDVAMNYRELLQSILQISSRSSDAKHTLPPISRKIAQSVTELVAVAELLKGNDWVDPDDPTVIAENELLGAAASIDAAAKKLACLRPRRSIQVIFLELLNFFLHLKFLLQRNYGGEKKLKLFYGKICLIFLVVYYKYDQESNILLLWRARPSEQIFNILKLVVNTNAKKARENFGSGHLNFEILLSCDLKNFYKNRNRVNLHFFG